MSDNPNDRDPERVPEEKELPAPQHPQQTWEARPQGHGAIWKRLAEELTQATIVIRQLPALYIAAWVRLWAILLNVRASRFYKRGRYAEAQSLFRQALRILQKAFGETHPETLSTLNNLALCLDSQERSAEAYPLHEQYFILTQADLGEKHPNTLVALRDLVYSLDSLEPSVETLARHEQCFTFSVRSLGEKHADTLTALNNWAVCLYALDRSAEALPLYERCLALRREVLGEKDPNTLVSLNSLAFCLTSVGRSAEAFPFYERCLELRREVLGEKHPDTLASLNNLGFGLSSLGRSAEALPLIERCLALRKEVLGEKHPNALISLNNLALCLDALGRSTEALPPARHCLELRGEVLGEKHPDTLTSLNNLGLCLASSGRSSEAFSRYERCLELRKEVLGEKHPNTIISFNNLALCLDALGRSAEALPLSRRCLMLSQEVLGERHPLALTVLNNLAFCLDSLGHSAEALPLIERCLELRKELLGEKHPDTLVSLNSLAFCLSALGRSSEALPQYERCLELSREVLGEKHPRTLMSLNNLALCFGSLGSSSQALSHYERGFELSLDVLDAKHPTTLIYLGNLATCLDELGRFSEALARHERCFELSREVLGEKHPNTLASLNTLAGCLSSLGRSSEAFSLRLQSLLSNQDLLGGARALPDEVRRSYIGKFSFTLPLTLSLAVTLLELSADLLERLYTAVLRQKLIVSELHTLPQEAVLLERYPQFALQLRERTVLQQEYSHLYLTKPLESGERIADLEKQIQHLNASLMQQIPELKEEDKRLSLDRKVIALSLPTGSTLVEYIHYRRYDFASRQWNEERYAAFVLTAGEEGTLRLVDLGEAAPIEALVQTFRHQQAGRSSEKEKSTLLSSTSLPQPTKRAGPPQATAKRATPPIEQLVLQIWKPLLPTSHSQQRLFVVPDGQLGSLPFELIAQQPDVTYLAQATDLSILAARRQDLSLSPSLLFADPDYGTPQKFLSSTQEETDRTRVASSLRAGSLECSRLPGSYLEALRIRKQLPMRAYLREEARPALLTTFPRPSLLHLSTHGFSMEDLPLPTSQTNLLQTTLLDPFVPRLFSPLAQTQLNPMLRCGIAFAGARDFLAGRSEEGILTAQDFTGFDLRGTRILLSCCSTAAAVKRDGHGLLGLRTALFYAGARTLILTLWKVDDLATGIFMEELYRLLFTEKRAVNDALNGAKSYLKTITIRQLKQTFWLNGEAKEALLAWKQSHPALQEASDEDVVLDILAQRLEELANEEETRTPFAAERYWAPFVCYGDTSPFV